MARIVVELKEVSALSDGYFRVYEFYSPEQ